MEKPPSSVKGVSENNKERDIATFYKEREHIRTVMGEVVEASNLGESDKKLFLKVIDEFIENYIVRYAESGAVFDASVYDISRSFVGSLPFWNSKDREQHEVFRALRDTFLEKFRKPPAGY